MVKIYIGKDKFFYIDEREYKKLKSWREEREKNLVNMVCKIENESIF